MALRGWLPSFSLISVYVQNRGAFILLLQRAFCPLCPCMTILPVWWGHFLCVARWEPPDHILAMPESRHERVRRRRHILVEGGDLPPPIKTFKVRFRILLCKKKIRIVPDFQSVWDFPIQILKICVWCTGTKLNLMLARQVQLCLDLLMNVSSLFWGEKYPTPLADCI